MPIVKVNSNNRMKVIPNRAHTSVTLISIVLCCAGLSFAQVPSARPSPLPPRPVDGATKSPSQDETPLTTFEEEIRAKRAIKLAEKDHQENLNRAREIAQIGKELQESLKNKTSLDRNSLKKVERLEKLTKKIRGEMGGEEEEVKIVNGPSDLSSAVARVAEATESLSKDVQNTPRQVVSASVISNANVLLELIRVLRTFVQQP